MGLGDIRALYPDLVCPLYIAVYGALGRRSDSKALIENQAVKNLGDGPPCCGIGRTQRGGCRISPIFIKRRVWLSIVIF